MIVIDDTLLLGVLAGATPRPGLVGDVATTGAWYWRLNRAVFDDRSTGPLSRAFVQLPDEDQHRVREELRSLPEEIGLLSFRRLVPIMAAIHSVRRLNLLTAEAVAAALVLDADLAVTTRSSLLDDACDRLGIMVHLFA